MKVRLPKLYKKSQATISVDFTECIKYKSSEILLVTTLLQLLLHLAFSHLLNMDRTVNEVQYCSMALCLIITGYSLTWLLPSVLTNLTILRSYSPPQLCVRLIVQPDHAWLPKMYFVDPWGCLKSQGSSPGPLWWGGSCRRVNFSIFILKLNYQSQKIVGLLFDEGVNVIIITIFS